MITFPMRASGATKTTIIVALERRRGYTPERRWPTAFSQPQGGDGGTTLSPHPATGIGEAHVAANAWKGTDNAMEDTVGLDRREAVIVGARPVPTGAS